MGVVEIIAMAVAGFVLVGVLGLLRFFRSSRHRLTRPELRNRALRESEKLAEFVELRQGIRPRHDPVIQEHELSHRRVTLHDEETQKIYEKEHLPEISLLREQFAERNVRNRLLDDLYESAGNEADLRTISTALEEMAGRLRRT